MRRMSCIFILLRLSKALLLDRRTLHVLIAAHLSLPKIVINCHSLPVSIRWELHLLSCNPLPAPITMPLPKSMLIWRNPEPVILPMNKLQAKVKGANHGPHKRDEYHSEYCSKTRFSPTISAVSIECLCSGRHTPTS